MRKAKAIKLLVPVIRPWMTMPSRHFADDAAKEVIATLEKAGVKFSD